MSLLPENHIPSHLSYTEALASLTPTAAVSLHPASTTHLSQDSLMQARPAGPLYSTP